MALLPYSSASLYASLHLQVLSIPKILSSSHLQRFNRPAKRSVHLFFPFLIFSWLWGLVYEDGNFRSAQLTVLSVNGSPFKQMNAPYITIFVDGCLMCGRLGLSRALRTRTPPKLALLS